MTYKLFTITLRAAALFGCFAVCAAAGPSLQAQVTERMNFNVPFQFAAGNEILPAGEYTVRPVSEARSAFIVQSTDNKHTAIMTVRNTFRSNRGQQRAELVFNVYQGQCFLAQIKPGPFSTASEVTRSRAERELMRVAAADTRQVTLLAAR